MMTIIDAASQQGSHWPRRVGVGVASCKGCGGPVRADSKYGYCTTEPECKRQAKRASQHVYKSTHKPWRWDSEIEGGRQYRRDHPEFGHFVNAKARAKKKGLPFTITREDISSALTDTCPVFGIPLQVNEGTKRKSHGSPSLDRIDSSKGYVPGNIQIISDKANTMKQDATPEELLQFADWIYATFGKGVKEVVQ